MRNLILGIEYVFENPCTSDINKILVRLIVLSVFTILCILTVSTLNEFTDKNFSGKIYRPPKD